MKPARQSSGWTGGAAWLALVTFSAYLPVIRHGGFIWDDYFTVATSAPGGLRQIWTWGGTLDYWPMSYSAFWLEQHLWGMQPMGYHLVNVALHAVNAVLAWRLLNRLGAPAAWFAAAVFALHPVHVESVAWITELKNSLSGLFFLSAAA